MIGRLVAGEADDRLSMQELFANIVLLLIAGHENSSSVIANGAVWLIGSCRNAGCRAWPRRCRAAGRPACREALVAQG